MFIYWINSVTLLLDQPLDSLLTFWCFSSGAQQTVCDFVLAGPGTSGMDGLLLFGGQSFVPHVLWSSDSWIIPLCTDWILASSFLLQGGILLVMAYTVQLQAKDLNHQHSVCQPLAVSDGHSRGTVVCGPAFALPNRLSERIYTTLNAWITIWHITETKSHVKLHLICFSFHRTLGLNMQ